ncbi:ABC transporter permease [Rosenbergiella australiborealis]|uniref:ABC transporter permease n=1 Tax=Rosenbergiella australiborealis TaxID=1544696 RepID=UPI001F4E5419|nr:ABC transporter permease [Rosenbergiella australiborealis]
MLQNNIFSALIKKEFKEIIRDKIIILLIIAMPIINLIIMGYSVNMDSKNISTVVIDNDNSLFSRNIINGMRTSGYFNVDVQHDGNPQRKSTFTRDVKIVIHIPASFSKDILNNRDSQILVETDATDPNSTANALQVLQYLISHVQDKELRKFSAGNGKSNVTTTLISRKWYNPTGDTKINIIPGLIGMILSIMPMLMASLSIVKERERGTLLHIHNAGIGGLHYIIGKSIPYLIIGIIQLTLMLMVSVIVMKIPMQGSYFELIAVSILFIVLSVTIGIILTTLIHNQLQAMQILSFYFLFSNMLSGFLSPFEAMPIWSQILGSLIPLTHFIRLVRGIMIKGDSIFQMTNDLSHLFAIFIVTSLIAYILVNRRWGKSF